jgi:hypothetical protein
VLFTGFNTLLLIYPVEPLAKLFELMPISKKNHHVVFRLWLLAFPGVHFLAAVFIEVRCNEYCRFDLCKNKTFRWMTKSRRVGHVDWWND